MIDTPRGYLPPHASPTKRRGVIAGQLALATGLTRLLLSIPSKWWWHGGQGGRRSSWRRAAWEEGVDVVHSSSNGPTTKAQLSKVGEADVLESRAAGGRVG